MEFGHSTAAPFSKKLIEIHLCRLTISVVGCESDERIGGIDAEGCRVQRHASESEIRMEIRRDQKIDH